MTKVVTIDSSFKPTVNTAFTKKGNRYERTNVAKKIGMLAGGGISLVNTIKNRNDIVSFANHFHKEAECCKNMSLNKTIAWCSAAEFGRQFAKFGIAALAIGTLTNFVINKVRAHNADKQ